MITYNHAPFIGEAIESVLMQQAPFDYELIIGEDCSTDATREIVVEYQRRYPDRIRLMLQPVNIGWRANGAQVLSACRGTYIAPLEGDDYWTDVRKLALQVQLLEANPTAFMCGARAQVCPEDANGPPAIAPSGDQAVLASYGARELFDGTWWFRTCTKMFPRHVLQSTPAQFSDGDWAEIMWLIAKTNFGPVCFLDRVVGVYREHAGGVWSALARHDRVISDVRVLYDLIPVFSGEPRASLTRRMSAYVTELIETTDVRAWDRIRCAGLALVRNSNDPAAWRRLAAALWSTTPLPRQT